MLLFLTLLFVSSGKVNSKVYLVRTCSAMCFAGNLVVESTVLYFVV